MYVFHVKSFYLINFFTEILLNALLLYICDSSFVRLTDVLSFACMYAAILVYVIKIMFWQDCVWG